MTVIIVVKINVAHILSMVIIFEVISDVADDCNNCSQNQRSPYFEYCTPSGPKYLQQQFRSHKIFIGEFQNRKKTTQAPLVYINAHSCVYNKCLIVISRRDMIERRGPNKR